MLADVGTEEVEVLGAPTTYLLRTLESIAFGHKVALQAITAGASIVKYGVPIGLATEPILPGGLGSRSQLPEQSRRAGFLLQSERRRHRA